MANDIERKETVLLGWMALNASAFRTLYEHFEIEVRATGQIINGVFQNKFLITADSSTERSVLLVEFSTGIGNCYERIGVLENAGFLVRGLLLHKAPTSIKDLYHLSGEIEQLKTLIEQWGFNNSELGFQKNPKSEDV